MRDHIVMITQAIASGTRDSRDSRDSRTKAREIEQQRRRRHHHHRLANSRNAPVNKYEEFVVYIQGVASGIHYTLSLRIL